MSLQKNDSNSEQISDSISKSPSTDASASVVAQHFYHHPELHRLLNQLLLDSEHYVNELIAEIRIRRDKKRSRQNSESKSSTKRRTRLLPSTKAVLQKWFEDHISYPYPTATEKQQLIEQCGGNVTAAMVANWFFNTRKRVNWRPASSGAVAGRAGRRPAKPASCQQRPPAPNRGPL